MNRRALVTILVFVTPIAAFLSWRSCSPVKSPSATKVDMSSQKPDDEQISNLSDPNLAQQRRDQNSASGRVPSSEKIKTEMEFMSKYPGNWMFKRGDKGKLNYITGGIIPNGGKSTDSIRDFIDVISPLLEASAGKLTSPKEISKTDLSRVYQIFESYDGYDIYQAMLSIHVRESDDAIFMINNQLKDVTGYNNTIRYTKDQAQSYLQNKYGNEITKLEFKQGPVIFSNGETPSELAWVFLMTYKVPALHMVEIVVSAASGEEIYQQSVTIQ